MTKKIRSFALLAGMLGLVAFGTIRADSFHVDSTIATPYYSSAHFNYGGNDFAGLLLPRGELTLTTGEIVSLNGVDKICTKQILGYYINPQRGNRTRPLDSASLLILQSGNNSYSGLVITGGLFTACSGVDAHNVYGQIKHSYRGSDYYLVAGVNYNFASGTYIPTFSGSAEFKSVLGKYAFNKYLYDTYGGIAKVVSSVTLYEGNTSLTGTVASGTVVDLSSDVVVVGTGITGYVEFTTGVNIVVSGSSWNGIIVPPTIVVGVGAATIGESGLPATGTVVMTVQAGATGTSLVASGGNFVVSFVVSAGTVGQTLNLYRSQDGQTWSVNSPSASCVLDSGKTCTFFTDHLSYFAVINPSVPSSPSSSVTTSVGGGSYRLLKDNCKRSANAVKNLSGANADGKDYSRSYYDRDCGSPADEAVLNTPTKITRLGSIAGSSYNTEMNQAYLYAYNMGLTSVDNIKDMDMKKVLTRKEMASLISAYAMIVLGLEPSDKNIGCDKFTDTKKLDGDAQLYIQLSCQLGLMGLNDTGKRAATKFNPNRIVTRAQFATVFSRLLFGTKYNGRTPYYQGHLAGLKSYGILKDIGYPQMQERIGYVMLMMLRSYKKEIGNAKYHAAAPENGIDALIGK